MIFFLSFEVEPRADSPDWKEYGGGQFNCWIQADDEEAARKRALEAIESDGWIIKQEDESWEVPEGHYEAGAPGLPYYTKAKQDGEAFIIHTWPPDGDERQAFISPEKFMKPSAETPHLLAGRGLRPLWPVLGLKRPAEYPPSTPRAFSPPCGPSSGICDVSLRGFMNSPGEAAI